MNLATVNAQFDALFASADIDTEPGFKHPTPEEIERVRAEIEEIKRRNREATPVPVWPYVTPHGDR